ncbi:cell division protein CrgA [Actinotalea sp. K2]|uniref:cell division protein CrgA n=1 Tax=Actinotalea sp. K2 TaxID=2939438 RepID=UPI002017750D|nr:cell division protein CrgA [Actinotalea sp. K2]MCL3860777.1 cell division protein CrgA [Actinotalea sp. K2]
MPESKPRKKPAYVPPPASAKPKGNPPWLVPTMLTLMIVGLIWIVVTYVTRTEWPLPIGNWNLAIGFAFVIAGFSLTTRWR